MNEASNRREGVIYRVFYWATIVTVALALLASVAGLAGGAFVLARHLTAADDPQGIATIPE